MTKLYYFPIFFFTYKTIWISIPRRWRRESCRHLTRRLSSTYLTVPMKGSGLLVATMSAVRAATMSSARFATTHHLRGVEMMSWGGGPAKTGLEEGRAGETIWFIAGIETIRITNSGRPNKTIRQSVGA